MLQLSLPGVADIGNYPPSDEDSVDLLVLGSVLHDHGQAWRICLISAASVGPELLRDGMDDAAQAPSGNGEYGKGTFAR